MTQKQVEKKRKEIGVVVRDKMKARGITVIQLSKITSMSKTIIYKIIRGEGYEINSLIKTCKHLDIDIMNIGYFLDL